MKKRIMLTVEKENFDKFQEYCKLFKLPQGQLSNSTNDMIKEMNQMFKRCQDHGKLSIKDLFSMMGDNIEEMMKEGTNDKQTQKAKGMAKKLISKP